jgi:hypothetical protein
MGMRKRIKEIKNWCPQQPDRLPTKLKTYSTPIAVVLVTTLIFGISFTLFSSQIAINQPISKVPLIETPVENFTQPSPSPTPFISQQKSLLTKEQAIDIAMPYINQYAKENNRTVTVVDTVFYELNGVGPVWDVFGAYQRTDDTGAQHWIIGYKVTVFADSGQIYQQQARGVM